MSRKTNETIARNIRMSLKKSLGLRQTISQDIMDVLIGDMETYIKSRAEIAKEKIRERFHGIKEENSLCKECKE